jgi:hypothetical protein
MKAPMDRFWAKVEKTDGCWIWAAGRTGEGYGSFSLNRRTLLAHRVAYEVLRGPIPVGLVLDHLCRNRACVNPKHLEPVTQQVNTMRGIGLAAINARKDRCDAGHRYDERNTHATPGMRRCRPCNAEAARRYRERRAFRAAGIAA